MSKNNQNNLIKQMRKKMGYTQQEVADKMDVSRNIVIKVEQGERELKESELLELSKVLDTTPFVLLHRNVDPKERENTWQHLCEACNVGKRVQKTCRLLQAHGHFKAAGCLEKLLKNNIDESL